VRRGGDAVLYKGLSGLSEEIQAAEPARTILGAASPTVIPFGLAPGDARCLVRYAKQGHTPAALPRRAGMPAHQPLTAASAARVGAAQGPARDRRGRRR
jgi:hypothetical protein